jgi:hypothetical protein
MQKKISHEDNIVKEYYQWFFYQYEQSGFALCHHSPNENIAVDKTYRQKAINYNVKLTTMGRKKGFPDILILYKDKYLLLEFKYGKNKLSPKQKDIFLKLDKIGCKNKYVVYSFEEAKRHTIDFIKSNKTIDKKAI